jgi:hypothetical protein
MKKPVREWFEDVVVYGAESDLDTVKQLGAKLLYNLSLGDAVVARPDEMVDNLNNAIGAGFLWCRTPEGSAYWKGVFAATACRKLKG